MKVIKVGSEFGRSVYEQMDWEKVGDKYYGTAVVRHGKHIFTATEVLGDTGSTVSLIFRDGEHKAIVGRNSCVKSDPTQKAAATQTPTTTNNQPTAQVVKTSQKDKSFWCKADELLELGVEAISEEDMVTGARTLNVKHQEAAAKTGSQTLDLLVQHARSNGVKIYRAGEPQYERVRAVSDRLIAGGHYHKSPNVRYEVIDFDDVNAVASGGGNYAVFRGLMDVTTDDELAFIIGHELAHSSAGHLEEKATFLYTKDELQN